MDTKSQKEEKKKNLLRISYFSIFDKVSLLFSFSIFLSLFLSFSFLRGCILVVCS